MRKCKRGVKAWSLAGSAVALIVLVGFLVAFASSGASAAAVPSVQVHGLWPLPAWVPASGPEENAVPGEVLVRFAGGTDRTHIEADAGLAHASLARDLTSSTSSIVGPSLYLIHSTTRSFAQVIAALRTHSEVLQTSPNYLLHAVDVTPNDTLFPQMWDLKNTGQTGGKAGADIHATQAWTVSTGSSNVVVADIDTGIDYTHPDLAANVWQNADGTHGFNAITGTTDPMDDNGHGTHTAGTIGAVGNNGMGVTGVNWNVKIMGLKFLDNTGSGTTANAITCINWAIDQKVNHGVNVVAMNASWGGGGSNSLLKQAIDTAGQDGIIFCAAAGNNGTNNDTAPFYPAAYTSSNLIAVAATDATDTLASFSNYGPTSVELAAPGVSITSTYLNGQYAVYSGTSMATPHVTGAVALLAAVYPGDSVAQRIQRILANVDPIPSLAGKVATGGRLDLASAVGAAPVVTGISPSTGLTTGGTSVTITGFGFTGLSGTAAVTFGGVNATAYHVNSVTQITATAPSAAAGTVDVVVTNPGGSSATGPADQFTYGVPPVAPAVTGINPTSGPAGGGTSVTITGTGFTGLPGTAAVTFGGVNATGYTVNTDTQITAVAPPHSAGAADVVVTNAGGPSTTSPADQFTYLPAPTVTGVSPTSGPATGGTSVTITGANLSGATAVSFGGTPATTYAVNSATWITATAPPHSAGTVDLVVTGPGGSSATSAADRFSFVGAPTVTAVSPNSGPTAGGTSVTITGSGFIGLSGTTAVTFGGASATTYTVNSSTRITATAPAHAAGPVDVVVTATGGRSATGSADQFTFVTAPTVTGVSPGSGPASGGTSATITGTGFTGLSGAAAVTFGGTNATSYTVNSATQITATAPARAAGTVDVVVTATGGRSATGSADQFTFVAAPTITGVSPSSGSTSGGTTVTITGTNLSGTTAVSFGGTAAASFTVSSSTQISAKIPAEAAGTVQVRVTTVGGSTASTSADYFSYITRIDQTNSAFVWSGNWALFSTTSAYGGGYQRASSSGAYVVVPFNGTRLDWIATKGVTTGIADVYVDNVLVKTINLAASVVAYQQNVFSTGVLASGYHTLKVVRNSGSATGKFITMDAVDVAGSLVPTTRIEETDTHLVWAPSSSAWTSSATTSASGGSYRYTNTSGAAVTVNFTGVSLNIVATIAPSYGNATITLDGVSKTVSLYNSTTAYKKTVWSSGFLTPGNHTVTITRAGTKSTSSTGYTIDLDAVDLIGVLR